AAAPARGGGGQGPGPPGVFAPDEGAACAAEPAATPTLATEPPPQQAPRAELPSRRTRARWLAWAGLAFLMLCTLAGIRALWPNRPESPPREPPTLPAQAPAPA